MKRVSLYGRDGGFVTRVVRDCHETIATPKNLREARKVLAEQTAPGKYWITRKWMGCSLHSRNSHSVVLAERIIPAVAE